MRGGGVYSATHPIILHPGGEEVRDGRRQTDRSLLVAGEDLLDVLLALAELCPGVSLVDGLA